MQEGVLGRYLITLVEVMESAYGISPQQLYSAAGVRSLDSESERNGKNRVSTAYADALWLAASALGDEKLGLYMGSAIHYTSYASLGHLLVTCETVGDAIRLAAENARYVGVGYFDLTSSRDELSLEYILAAKHPLADVRAVASLLPFSTLSKTGMQTVVPQKVWLQTPEPKDKAAFNKYFGVPVSFGAQTSGVSWALDTLKAPMRDANPALNELLLQHLKKEMEQGNSLTYQVTNILMALFHRGMKEPRHLCLAYLANILAMPRRSVQRALADEGHGFREILKEVRLTQAKNMLSRGSITIAEVSEYLGYSEAAAFVRAFRSEVGKSPSQYRAHCQKEKES